MLAERLRSRRDPDRLRRPALRDIQDVETDRLGGHVARLASDVREDLEETVETPAAYEVSIVVVSYNSRKHLERLLPSLYDTPCDVSLETIVVDNASSDGTPAFVRERFPRVRTIENAANMGYSRAVNQGIHAARGRYVLILNPDIEVSEGAIRRLHAFMEEHPRAGIAGAKLLNADGSVQHSCRRFYSLWTLLLRRTPLGKLLPRNREIPRYLMLDFDHASSREVDWIIGACMMVRREALADIGLMDERFFLYFEDVDWCYRAWRAGWKVYYVADSVMTHRYARESASTSKLLFAHILSMLRYYEKWGSLIYAMKKYRHVILVAMLLVSDLVAVNGSFSLAFLLRSSLQGLLEKPMFGFGIYRPFLVFANIVILFSFAFFGLYGRRIEREPAPDILLRIFRATAAAGIVLMASTYLTSQTLYSRVLVAAFLVLLVVVSWLLRLAGKAIHRSFRAGSFDLARVAVVGTGPEATGLAAGLVERRELGYDLVGLVTTDGERHDAGFPVVGTLDELPRLVEEQRIAEVVFADPDIPNEKVAGFLLAARKSTVDVRMVSGLSGILTRRARVEEFLGLPVVTFEREALLKAGAGAKRALDIVGAALLVVVWSPVLALQTIGAAARGRRPLHLVPRLGVGGTVFGLVALTDLDRPGPLRRFAERHCLSRVPGALNVLAGDMSMVGPEPLPPGSLEKLGPAARVRLDARPGLMSLSGAPTARREGQRESDRLEAYYVQNWSLGGDARIVLRWIGRAFAGRCSGTSEPKGRNTA
ncbi:MAG: glycosyltransferase [Candidatus Eisenbacteria bacterium]|nr:glycosyltransferase [Candidatus Eisenbacteria bacterium]